MHHPCLPSLTLYIQRLWESRLPPSMHSQAAPPSVGAHASWQAMLPTSGHVSPSSESSNGLLSCLGVKPSSTQSVSRPTLQPHLPPRVPPCSPPATRMSFQAPSLRSNLQTPFCHKTWNVLPPGGHTVLPCTPRGSLHEGHLLTCLRWNPPIAFHPPTALSFSIILIAPSQIISSLVCLLTTSPLNVHSLGEGPSSVVFIAHPQYPAQDTLYYSA